MATRPVFTVSNEKPWFKQWDLSFEYNRGLSPTQKKKNVVALHDEYERCFKHRRILEISSKSMQPCGEALSAFFLKKFVPSLNASVPVENVYQAGKVFEHGGPHTDLLTVTPRAAKRDERLRTSGDLLRFSFEGDAYAAVPKTAFYDYIYINALLENEELAKAALEFDAFTDIEFSPAKSLNCQARAAAKFVSLYRAGRLDVVRDYKTFCENCR